MMSTKNDALIEVLRVVGSELEFKRWEVKQLERAHEREIQEGFARQKELIEALSALREVVRRDLERDEDVEATRDEWEECHLYAATLKKVDALLARFREDCPVDSEGEDE